MKEKEIFSPFAQDIFAAEVRLIAIHFPQRPKPGHDPDLILEHKILLCSVTCINPKTFIVKTGSRALLQLITTAQVVGMVATVISGLSGRENTCPPSALKRDLG